MSSVVTVIGATGAQQGAVASRFNAAGWGVRGTSRTQTRGGVGAIYMADPDSGLGLASAMSGSDVVVLTLPQDHRAGAMTRVAANVVAAAKEAGIGRLVLNTAGTIDEKSAGSLFADMRVARETVLSSGIPAVVLQPTVFMDNLLAPWSLPAIAQQGVLAYPAPEAIGISWLSHRSLADFVYAAATHAEAPGRDLRIGGPDVLTSTELCALLGARLGRTIQYHRIPLDGFAAGLDQAFGAPAGERIASLYARLEQEPDAMAVDGAAAAFLGVKPESFTQFASRINWA
ncbi:MAG: SDR family oxidoreductase [Beijerinckiaceae bacterium]